MDKSGGWRESPPLARAPTGVAGLDRVLRGGWVAGGVVLLAGSPGTGKTTLGNQLVFRHAAAGHRAVFATVMAESHDRMLQHMRAFRFFDPAFAGQAVQYLSLLPALDAGGLDGVLEAIRGLVRAQGATLLVVDGTAAVDEFAASATDFRSFALRLQLQSALLGCTTVLLTSRGPDGIDDVATHTDGFLILRHERAGERALRTLEVVKMRGSAHLGGRHEFAITDNGIAVYPRLEAALADAGPPPEPNGGRLGFGLPDMDAMLGGGLLPSSSTLVMGTPGAGKTVTGLHFVVAGARAGEPGLFATFHESPRRLAAVAAGIGLDLALPMEAGLVRVLWQSPLERSPDAWAWDLLAAVAEHRPRRLVVDALTDLQRRIVAPGRTPDYVAALANALRAAGVTVLYAAELGTLVGPELSMPLAAMSAALDNAILLRQVEVASRLRRLISVLKLRQSNFDPAIREFVIGDQGIAVGGGFAGTAGLLTGAAGPGEWPSSVPAP